MFLRLRCDARPPGGSGACDRLKMLDQVAMFLFNSFS